MTAFERTLQAETQRLDDESELRELRAETRRLHEVVAVYRLSNADQRKRIAELETHVAELQEMLMRAARDAGE
jgi:hypothetical protein